MSPFADVRILITGAASGIGRALALQLSREGAAVAGIDRAAGGLAELESEVNGQPFAAAVADVSDRLALLAAVRQVESQLGPTDRLIACAGIGRGTAADPFLSADFEEIVRVNLLGVANAVEAVLPGMIARKRGHLVALSSLASFRGLPGMAAYCASKSGLNALFDALAVDLAPHNIHVTTICPGFIRTPMTEQLGQEFPGMMELDYAVGRILDAIRWRKRFVAFPVRRAWTLRLLRSMPLTWADRLMRRRATRMIGNTDLARPEASGPQ